MDVTADNAALRAQAVSIAKNQHYVDIGFKYLTQFFCTECTVCPSRYYCLPYF